MNKLTYTLAAVLFLAIASASKAQFSTKVVAVTGGQAPDGGTFSRFGFYSPTLNDAGDVAFSAFLANTNSGNFGNGVFRGGGASSLVQIALVGDAAPGNDGTFEDFRLGIPFLNNAGQTVFLAELDGASDGVNAAIYRSDVVGIMRLVAAGVSAPDGNGRVGLPTFDHVDPNASGQLVFLAPISETSDAPHDNSGLFLSDGANHLEQIARTGQPTPNGKDIFINLSDPTLNDAAQAAFRASLEDFDTGNQSGLVIFRADDKDNLVQIVRSGDPAPDGDGQVSFLGEPALNNLGQAAFFGLLNGTSGNTGRGIFRGDGSNGLTQIVRRGEIPYNGNGNGVFATTGRTVALNDAGQVAFSGDLSDENGNLNSRGIFLGDGTSSPIQIAISGQTAPDGNGMFDRFSDYPALNNNGQVAFTAEFIGTTGTNERNGIYVYDDVLGLQQVIREGDSLLGSTITRLVFAGMSQTRITERDSFNNHGQVAFEFTLADGREGIAIATPVPEPSTLLLGLCAAGGFVLRRGVAKRRTA